MELNRKFYAANTPGQGGGNPQQGPDDQDLSRAEKLGKIFSEMKNSIASISALLDLDLKNSLAGLEPDAKKIAQSLGRDLKKQLEDAKIRVNKLNDAEKGLVSNFSKSLKTVESIEKEIENVRVQQERINDITQYYQNKLEEIKDERGQEFDDQRQAYSLILSYNNDVSAQLAVQLRLLNQMLPPAQKIAAAMKGYANTLKFIGGLPFFGPIFSKLINLPAITTAMSKAAAQGLGRLQVLAVGLKETFTSIGKGILLSLVTGFFKAIELVVQFDQKVFNLAKDLGITVDKAQQLQKNFVEISKTSANFGLTAKEVAKTYTELSNTFGFLAPSNKEFAETAALIQKRLGASAEQMSALATQAVLSGQTIGKTYGTLQASAKIEGIRNKIYVSERQVLEAIAKTSTAVLINFKGSAESLAEAVVRATKLGTTLNQVNKQGDSLLDFESSIAKEFEAQILTGRNLNLTKAREFALLGQTKNLMEELNRQGATYEQFSKMHVIARKAEAEAIGLSLEEYTKILIQQKQANALGVQEGQSLSQRYDQLMKTVEGRKKLKEQLTEEELIDLRRASIQDRFNAALERFKDIIGSTLQGPVTKMLDKFVAFVSNTERMQKLATQIKSVFEGLANILSSLPGLLNGALQVSKVLTSFAIARAVASIMAGSAFSGPLAIAAGVAAYTWLNSLTDGLGGAPTAANIPATGGGMTTPVNAGLAYAQASAGPNAAGFKDLKPVINVKATTYVGTENWSNTTRTLVSQDPGTSFP